MNDVLVCVVRLGVALCIQECESTCLWEVRRPVSGSVACTLQRGLPALPLQIPLSLQVKVWVSDKCSVAQLVSHVVCLIRILDC